MSSSEFNYCAFIYGDRSEHDSNPKEKKVSLLWQNLFFSPFKIKPPKYVVSFFYPQGVDQNEKEPNVFELTSEKPLSVGRNKNKKGGEIINDINIKDRTSTVSGQHGKIIIKNGVVYYESISTSRSSWMMVRNKNYKIKKGQRYELGINHYLKVRTMKDHNLCLELFKETSEGEDESMFEFIIDDKTQTIDIGKIDCCLTNDDEDRKNIDDKHYRVEKMKDEYFIQDITSSTKNNGYIRLNENENIFINEEIIFRFGENTAQYKIKCEALE